MFCDCAFFFVGEARNEVSKTNPPLFFLVVGTFFVIGTNKIMRTMLLSRRKKTDGTKETNGHALARVRNAAAAQEHGGWVGGCERERGATRRRERTGGTKKRDSTKERATPRARASASAAQQGGRKEREARRNGTARKNERHRHRAPSPDARAGEHELASADEKQRRRDTVAARVRPDGSRHQANVPAGGRRRLGGGDRHTQTGKHTLSPPRADGQARAQIEFPLLCRDLWERRRPAASRAGFFATGGGAATDTHERTSTH